MGRLIGWNHCVFFFPGYCTYIPGHSADKLTFRGLGMEIAQIAASIAPQASIIILDEAPDGSGVFLSVTLGAVVRMTGTSATIQGLLRHDIQHNLTNLGMSKDAITMSITLIMTLPNPRIF
jgi:hypothetical protein